MRKKVKQLGYCPTKKGFIYVVHHGNGWYEYYAMVNGVHQTIMHYYHIKGRTFSQGCLY